MASATFIIPLVMYCCTLNKKNKKNIYIDVRMVEYVLFCILYMVSLKKGVIGLQVSKVSTEILLRKSKEV